MSLLQRALRSPVSFLKHCTRFWWYRNKPGAERQAIMSGRGEVADAARRGITLKPGWYQFWAETGWCLGFTFVCTCGTEIVYLGFDWMYPHNCVTCGKSFSLLHANGCDESTSLEHLVDSFQQLPTRYRNQFSRVGQAWLRWRGVFRENPERVIYV